MDEEKKILYKLIKDIKKVYNVEVFNDKSKNLTDFNQFNKGNLFKHLFTWKLNDFNNDIFLLSIQNSYEIELSGTGGMSYLTGDQPNRYISIVIESKVNLPNLILKPTNLQDVVSNFFLKFDRKISGEREFNNKYILETESNSEFLNELFSQSLILLLNKQKNFHMEINNSLILLKFEKEINQKDNKTLFKIAEIIDENLKNVA